MFGVSGSATSASFVVGGFSDSVQVSASLYKCVALSEKTQTSAKALRLCQYLSKHVRCRCEHLDCRGIIKTSVSVIKAMARGLNDILCAVPGLHQEGFKYNLRGFKPA